jgi:hypothetical protein
MSEEFADALDAEEHLASPLARLQGFIRAVLAGRTSAKDNYLNAYIRNSNQVPEGIHRELATKRHQVRQQVSRALTRLVSAAQAAGEIPASLDASLAALFIVGATNWVGLWYKPAGAKTAEQISGTFTSLLMHGLGGAEQNKRSGASAASRAKPRRR